MRYEGGEVGGVREEGAREEPIGGISEQGTNGYSGNWRRSWYSGEK